MAKGETDGRDCDTCDNRDTGAVSRERIEGHLLSAAKAVLNEVEGRRAAPGWTALWKSEPAFFEVGQLNLPTLTEDKAAALVKRAKSDWDAFDAAAYLAGIQFQMGDSRPAAECPLSLRLFGAGVLMGEIKRPPQPGRRRAADVPLRLWQYILVRFTAEGVPLPVTRNRESEANAFTACEAVAQAFTDAGRRVTEGQLASLYYDTAYAEIRALAKALWFSHSPDK